MKYKLHVRQTIVKCSSAQWCRLNGTFKKKKNALTHTHTFLSLHFHSRKRLDGENIETTKNLSLWSRERAHWLTLSIETIWNKSAVMKAIVPSKTDPPLWYIACFAWCWSIFHKHTHTQRNSIACADFVSCLMKTIKTHLLEISSVFCFVCCNLFRKVSLKCGWKWKCVRASFKWKKAEKLCFFHSIKRSFQNQWTLDEVKIFDEIWHLIEFNANRHRQRCRSRISAWRSFEICFSYVKCTKGSTFLSFVMYDLVVCLVPHFFLLRRSNTFHCWISWFMR